LSAVKSGPRLQPDRPEPLDDRLGAADAARGAVKGCEDAVPGGLDQAAAVLIHEGLHEGVVALEERSPALVAQVGGSGSGVHQVREHDGGENPVQIWLRLAPGKKLL